MTRNRTERVDFSGQELSRPALVLAQQFVQRWDLYARQLDDGRYICIHELLNIGHLFSHLRGDITLGTYLLDKQNQTRFIVFDADDEQGIERLSHFANSLAKEDIPAYLEKSRRGGHLWLFFSQALSGKAVREFGRGLLAAHQVEEVELFPKQDQLGTGPGSLVRMPFGVHRLTGRRYGFYNSAGSLLAPTIREQIEVFSTPQFVSEATFAAYRSYSSVEKPSAQISPTEPLTDQLSDKIKATMTVLEFVSQYIDLKPTPTGALGRCPFHDDQHPSFGVNDEGNYWHCFAGCGGGSVIDFWMRWHECDFTTAVRELAEIVL